MTATLVHFSSHAGYVLLLLLVAGESTGVPLPGETALITGGVMASNGHFSIALIIAVAAVGAVLGDNSGYVIGRTGGRRLLERPGPMHGHRQAILTHGEPFFARHGPKAVFLGRWFAGLRIAAAWLAGINRMHWPTFAFWNVAGGIAWAATVGYAAYLLGPTAEHLFKTVGLAGVALVAIGALAFFVWRRRRVASS